MVEMIPGGKLGGSRVWWWSESKNCEDEPVVTA